MSAPEEEKTFKTSPARLAAARAWKIKNRERNKQINDARNSMIQADPVLRAKKLESCRRSNKKNYRKRLEYDRSRDPEKIAARNMVRHRIADGRMQRKPCEICLSRNAHAHHDDYSKPLDVRWLCPKHHAEYHKQHGYY